MKLLLTSGGLTTKKIKKEFLRLVGKKPEDITVGFIATAADPEEDKSWIEENKKPLYELGTKIKEIDIKEKTKEQLLKDFKNVDVIWVNGGNTFYLLYWARKSGFNQVIKKLLATGKVYVGVSAGSILVGPSIKVASLKGYDDSSIVTLENLTGLNLINFNIFAHYTPKWDKLVKENKGKLKEELVCLNDKQAIVVENNNKRLV